MKIVELKSSNIKRIKAIELHLDKDKNLVMITGKNAAGKTSVLDSIWYALGGRKASSDKPIRKGEEKGEIRIDADGYIITKTFLKGKSHLTVNNKEGTAYSNPQEFLDYIIGNLSFDPLEFSRLNGKKQVEELTKIVGLDFAPLEEKKGKLTEERVMIGREIKVLAQYNESEIAEAEKLKDKQEISVAELSNILEKENNQHNVYIESQERIKTNKEAIATMKKQIAQIEENILEYEANIKKLSIVKDTQENIEELKNKIGTAEAENTKIREAKNVLANNAKVISKKEEYNKLTQDIGSVEEEKKTKLAEAKMPIEGLSWEEEKVLYNQIPYNQISAAEQLRVSMAIAMASNPKLKVILIRDGSLLDKDNMKVIEEMARDKDFQVWMEKIDDSGKVGIYLEDGEVKSINK